MAPLNAGIHFVKTESMEGELCSNGATATQNYSENMTAGIWEYRTNVNGMVSSGMVLP